MVEDEAFVALAIVAAFRRDGAVVVGPAATLDEAVSLARNEEVDAAVLDIDLGGFDVFPAADVLAERSVPFVFHTGHGLRDELKVQYPGVTVCKKPTPLPKLVDAVGRLVEQKD